MNKTDLYNFTVQLLDGNTDVQDSFDTLLDVAQSNRENMRPWVILRSEDATQTVSPATSFTTAIPMPADFRKWYSRFPIVLLDSQGNAIRMLREVPMTMKNTYKNDETKFYTNYRTKMIYICGSRSQTYTVSQNYLARAPLISTVTTPATTWVFPDEYHKILAFDVAVMHKLGIDYDVINNQQGNNNAAQAEIIFRNMSEWDNELANSTQQGVDYGSNISGGFTDLTGNANNLLL